VKNLPKKQIFLGSIIFLSIITNHRAAPQLIVRHDFTKSYDQETVFSSFNNVSF